MTIPIAAISRLNAHARSRRGGTLFSSERDAIYAWKTYAALTLARDGTAALRFVRWRGTCAYCDKGRFHHWEWDDGVTVACRDCGGTGIRTLHFTETTLPGGHVWHHPWQGRVTPGRDIAVAVRGSYEDGDIEWSEPGEWHPLLPAAPLPLAELVPLLNDVEDWVAAVPEPVRGSDWWWIADNARRTLRGGGYRLDLGRAPGGCFVCGDERDIVTNFGMYAPAFHWSLPVCGAHRNSPHPKDPPPACLITPDLARWLDRRERVEAAA